MSFAVVTFHKMNAYARLCTHFGDISKKTNSVSGRKHILRTRLIVKLKFCNAMAQRGLNLACGKRKVMFGDQYIFFNLPNKTTAQPSF